MNMPWDGGIYRKAICIDVNKIVVQFLHQASVQILEDDSDDKGHDVVCGW